MENYNIKKEIWKDVEGFEGLYQVSDRGRVKSLNRVVSYGDRHYTIREKIKKGTIKSRGSQKGGGYVVVSLYKDNKSHMNYVHRLVAKAFILNVDNKLTVNHKDGDKTNNNIENLEWMTYAENNEHAYMTGLTTYENRKNEQSKSISVKQFDLKWNFIASFQSMREAQRITGCDATRIGKCCKNKKLTSGGYHWSR